jgi:hypothetical protein
MPPKSQLNMTALSKKPYFDATLDSIKGANMPASWWVVNRAMGYSMGSGVISLL